MSIWTLWLLGFIPCICMAAGGLLITVAKQRYQASCHCSGPFIDWKQLFATEYGAKAKVGWALVALGVALWLILFASVAAAILHNPHFLTGGRLSR